MVSAGHLSFLRGFIIPPAPQSESRGLPKLPRWSLFAGRVDITRRSALRYTSGMTATTHPRITIEPGKCGGKPCIRGMRIRVSDVLGLLANGASVEEILADYPCLERDDILAAIAYAAQQTNHVVVEVA